MRTQCIGLAFVVSILTMAMAAIAAPPKEFNIKLSRRTKLAISTR